MRPGDKVLTQPVVHVRIKQALDGTDTARRASKLSKNLNIATCNQRCIGGIGRAQRDMRSITILVDENLRV